MVLKDIEKCPFCKRAMMLSALYIRNCTNKSCDSDMFQHLHSTRKDVLYKFLLKQKSFVVKIYLNSVDPDENCTKIFSNDPKSRFFYGKFRQEGEPIVALFADESIVPNFKKIKELEDKLNVMLTFG